MEVFSSGKSCSKIMGKEGKPQSGWQPSREFRGWRGQIPDHKEEEKADSSFKEVKGIGLSEHPSVRTEGPVLMVQKWTQTSQWNHSPDPQEMWWALAAPWQAWRIRTNFQKDTALSQRMKET